MDVKILSVNLYGSAGTGSGESQWTKERITNHPAILAQWVADQIGSDNTKLCAVYLCEHYMFNMGRFRAALQSKLGTNKFTIIHRHTRNDHGQALIVNRLADEASHGNFPYQGEVWETGWVTARVGNIRLFGTHFTDETQAFNLAQMRHLRPLAEPAAGETSFVFGDFNAGSNYYTANFNEWSAAGWTAHNPGSITHPGDNLSLDQIESKGGAITNETFQVLTTPTHNGHRITDHDAVMLTGTVGS